MSARGAGNRPRRGPGRSAAPAPGRNPRETEVEGILVPLAWDESGRATGLGFNTDGEMELQVQVPDLEALRKFLRRRLRVKGRVDPDEKVIRITGFRVVGSPGDDSPDGEEDR